MNNIDKLTISVYTYNILYERKRCTMKRCPKCHWIVVEDEVTKCPNCVYKTELITIDETIPEYQKEYEEQLAFICVCGEYWHPDNTYVPPTDYELRVLQESIDRGRKEQEYKEAHPNAIQCPKCGSFSVSTTARGVSMFWGFIGANKTVNRCGNCGYTWKPNGR
jgi:hypothetical protein